MSFFFSNIISTFEELFNTNPSYHSLDDHTSNIMSAKINEKYFVNTTTIGYINNSRFKNIKETGCFIIMITSQDKSGPSAIYCIARSDILSKGNIKELIKSDGVNGDSLELEWDPYEYPLVLTKLNSNKRKNQSQKITYLVKVISNF